MGARISEFKQAFRRVFVNSLPKVTLGRRTSRVIVRQLEFSMRVMAVALIAQVCGASLLVGILWNDVSHLLLMVWGAVVCAAVVLSIEFNRLFLGDQKRVARIRGWLRAELALSLFSGLIWGFAGAVFPYFGSSAALAAPLAAVIGVALASWPFYAMWMPGLVCFAFSALFPTLVALTANFMFTSRGAVGIAFVVVFGVMLYSGRRLNDAVLSQIIAEADNRKLLQQLARERNTAEAARREAEEGSARRQKFFRAANHDLRQPLQALGLFLQILKRKATPETEPVVSQLDVCAKSISDLVEQILEVSRISADTLEIRRERIPARDFVRGLQQEFEQLAGSRGIAFSSRCDDVVLDTDAALLSRVVRNLLTNAVKYMDKAEGGEVILSVRRRAGERVQIAVYDNGPGICREDREKIFNSFFRCEAGKRASDGFGLGLSIVRGICERLGIGVSVSSKEGGGTVFRLLLGEAAASEPQAFESRGSVKDENPVEPLPARVLYLEDNVTVSRSVQFLLESWGAEVLYAPFADDGLAARAKEFSPDVILTDFNLGNGAPNGIDSVLSLSHGLKRAIPAVILTAVPEDRVESAWKKRLPHRARAEMPSILRKPVTESALNGALIRAWKSVGKNF